MNTLCMLLIDAGGDKPHPYTERAWETVGVRFILTRVLLRQSSTASLHGIAMFLDYNFGQFALQGYTIQQVVTKVVTYAGKFFFDLIFVHVGHDHLIQIKAHTRKG